MRPRFMPSVLCPYMHRVQCSRHLRITYRL